MSRIFRALLAVTVPYRRVRLRSACRVPWQ